MEPAKKKRIITAALKEFAEHGFARASTNRIVKAAGIGKGMLFYYFKTKKDLLYYLIDYAAGFITIEYLNKIDENQGDFIERCRQSVQAKMAAITKNPHAFSFLGSLYINKEGLPEDVIAQLVAGVQSARAKLYDNIDISLFRDDIAPETVMKLIRWSLEGIEKEIVSNLQGKNLAAVDFGAYDLTEFDNFLEVLKKLYYK